MKKILPFALAPLSLMIAGMALAAETALPETVVTADRSLAGNSSQLDAATVITRADIERTQPDSLASLLSRAAGVSIPANGGPLTTTGVFIRGFKSNQVLILVDGVRVNDANQGSLDLSLIRPDDIERIEVVRGGYSSQYGSDAMGGIIQIFTRRQDATTLSYRTGSYQTQEASIGSSITRGSTRISAGLSQLDTSGFDATNAGIGFPTSSDRDGGTQRTARLGLEHKLGNGAEISVRTLLKDGEVEFDDGISEQTFALVNGQYRQRLGENFRHQIDASWQRNQIDTPVFDSRFETLRTGLDWAGTLEESLAGNLTVGLSLTDEKAISEPLNGGSTFDKRLGTAGVYLINNQEHGRWSTRLSARHDYHETYGNFDTGSARVGYRITDDVLLTAGYGTNFRAPTANDLYFPGYCGGIAGPFCFAGNPNLKPEESRQGDIGLTWQANPNHRVRATAYRSLVDNLIAMDAASAQSINVSKAQLRGVELELGGHIGNTSYQLAASRAQVTSASTAAKIRRPRSQLTGSIDQKLSDTLHAGIELSSRNSTPDSGGDVDGFALWNAYASWQATRHLTLGVRVENLSDKRYETLRGYNTADRSGYVTARYTF